MFNGVVICLAIIIANRPIAIKINEHCSVELVPLVENARPDETDIKSLIDARNAARKSKDFHEADRIRDELKTMGIVLKDNPDGTTTPEIAR